MRRGVVRVVVVGDSAETCAPSVSECRESIGEALLRSCPRRPPPLVNATAASGAPRAIGHRYIQVADPRMIDLLLLVILVMSGGALCYVVGPLILHIVCGLIFMAASVYTVRARPTIARREVI